MEDGREAAYETVPDQLVDAIALGESPDRVRDRWRAWKKGRVSTPSVDEMRLTKEGMA